MDIVALNVESLNICILQFVNFEERLGGQEVAEVAAGVSLNVTLVRIKCKVALTVFPDIQLGGCKGAVRVCCQFS